MHPTPSLSASTSTPYTSTSFTGTDTNNPNRTYSLIPALNSRLQSQSTIPSSTYVPPHRLTPTEHLDPLLASMVLPMSTTASTSWHPPSVFQNPLFTPTSTHSNSNPVPETKTETNTTNHGNENEVSPIDPKYFQPLLSASPITKMSSLTSLEDLDKDADLMLSKLDWLPHFNPMEHADITLPPEDGSFSSQTSPPFPPSSFQYNGKFISSYSNPNVELLTKPLPPNSHTISSSSSTNPPFHLSMLQSDLPSSSTSSDPTIFSPPLLSSSSTPVMNELQDLLQLLEKEDPFFHSASPIPSNLTTPTSTTTKLTPQKSIPITSIPFPLTQPISDDLEPAPSFSASTSTSTSPPKLSFSDQATQTFSSSFATTPTTTIMTDWQPLLEQLVHRLHLPFSPPYHLDAILNHLHTRHEKLEHQYQHVCSQWQTELQNHHTHTTFYQSELMKSNQQVQRMHELFIQFQKSCQQRYQDHLAMLLSHTQLWMQTLPTPLSFNSIPSSNALVQQQHESLSSSSSSSSSTNVVPSSSLTHSQKKVNERTSSFNTHATHVKINEVEPLVHPSMQVPPHVSSDTTKSVNLLKKKRNSMTPFKQNGASIHSSSVSPTHPSQVNLIHPTSSSFSSPSSSSAFSNPNSMNSKPPSKPSS